MEEQVVDFLTGGAGDHRDAPLFTIIARVTDPRRLDEVRDAIIGEIDRMKVEMIDPQILADTKSHMRYQFAMGLNNPGAVARTLAHYLQLTGDPETVNRVYRLYDSVTPEDIQHVATTYFPETNRTVVALTEKSQLGQDESGGE